MIHEQPQEGMTENSYESIIAPIIDYCEFLIKVCFMPPYRETESL